MGTSCVCLTAEVTGARPFEEEAARVTADVGAEVGAEVGERGVLFVVEVRTIRVLVSIILSLREDISYAFFSDITLMACLPQRH